MLLVTILNMVLVDCALPNQHKTLTAIVHPLRSANIVYGTPKLLICDSQTPLVAVLTTGGGKSSLFNLPTCMGEAGVRVVVVPYRALLKVLINCMHSIKIGSLVESLFELREAVDFSSVRPANGGFRRVSLYNVSK
jgi:hypothetical protein